VHRKESIPPLAINAIEDRHERRVQRGGKNLVVGERDQICKKRLHQAPLKTGKYSEHENFRKNEEKEGGTN